mgnify:CR=1 FL=1|jgi:hypothetical protein
MGGALRPPARSSRGSCPGQPCPLGFARRLGVVHAFASGARIELGGGLRTTGSRQWVQDVPLIDGRRSRARGANRHASISVPNGVHPLFDCLLRSGVHRRSGLGGGVCTTLCSLPVEFRSQLVRFRSQPGKLFLLATGGVLPLSPARGIGVESCLDASVSSCFCRCLLARSRFGRRRRRGSEPAPEIGRSGSSDDSVGAQSGVGRNLRRRQVSHLWIRSGGLRHLELGEIVLLEFEFGVQTASFFLRGDASGFDL